MKLFHLKHFNPKVTYLHPQRISFISAFVNAIKFHENESKSTSFEIIHSLKIAKAFLENIPMKVRRPLIFQMVENQDRNRNVPRMVSVPLLKLASMPFAKILARCLTCAPRSKSVASWVQCLCARWSASVLPILLSISVVNARKSVCFTNNRFSIQSLQD